MEIAILDVLYSMKTDHLRHYTPVPTGRYFRTYYNVLGPLRVIDVIFCMSLGFSFMVSLLKSDGPREVREHQEAL